MYIMNHYDVIDVVLPFPEWNMSWGRDLHHWHRGAPPATYTGSPCGASGGSAIDAGCLCATCQWTDQPCLWRQSHAFLKWKPNSKPILRAWVTFKEACESIEGLRVHECLSKIMAAVAPCDVLLWLWSARGVALGGPASDATHCDAQCVQTIFSSASGVPLDAQSCNYRVPLQSRI